MTAELMQDLESRNTSLARALPARVEVYLVPRYSFRERLLLLFGRRIPLRWKAWSERSPGSTLPSRLFVGDRETFL